MRRYLYLVTEHEDDDMVGCAKILESRSETARKNVETPYHTFDGGEGGIKWAGKQVSMGHADFEDEDDFDARGGDVVDRKLLEIDVYHLEKAGVDVDAIRERVGAEDHD